MGHFQVRDALKKCSPSNVFKCKEKDDVWGLKFAEKEDRYIFNQVVNRGVSFGGTRLVAKLGLGTGFSGIANNRYLFSMVVGNQ